MGADTVGAVEVVRCRGRKSVNAGTEPVQNGSQPQVDPRVATRGTVTASAGGPSLKIGDGVADELPEVIEGRPAAKRAIAFEGVGAERQVARRRLGIDERDQARIIDLPRGA